MLDKSSAHPATMWWWKSSLTGPSQCAEFTDGKVVRPLVVPMDHKRANDHDTGLNTGGMAPLP